MFVNEVLNCVGPSGSVRKCTETAGVAAVMFKTAHLHLSQTGNKTLFEETLRNMADKQANKVCFH